MRSHRINDTTGALPHGHGPCPPSVAECAAAGLWHVVSSDGWLCTHRQQQQQAASWPGELTSRRLFLCRLLFCVVCCPTAHCLKFREGISVVVSVYGSSRRLPAHNLRCSLLIATFTLMHPLIHTQHHPGLPHLAAQRVCNTARAAAAAAIAVGQGSRGA